MKANRLLESLQSATNLSSFQGMSFDSRAISLQEEVKKSPGNFEKKISVMRSELFVTEEEEGFRLEDEFSAGDIAKVVAGCRSRIVESAMTSEIWNQIGEYLVEELWEFSRLKEDLSLADRKYGMVQKKMSELTQISELEVKRSRLMACAMLLAEVEMRRDNLQTRISGIVDSFVERILIDLERSKFYHEMEIRLRAVFSSL